MPFRLRIPVNVYRPDGRGQLSTVEIVTPGIALERETFETDDIGRATITLDLADVSGRTRGRQKIGLKASGHDRHGVKWAGSTSIVVDPGGRVRRRIHPEVSIEVERIATDVAALAFSINTGLDLVGDDLGDLIMDDFLELHDVLRASLPAAGLSMVGKILDGYLKFRGRKGRWWKSEFDKLPLGALLSDPDVEKKVRDRLGIGFWDRLRGSAVYVRNVAAHQKYSPVTIQGAIASAKVVVDAVNLW